VHVLTTMQIIFFQRSCT